MLPKWWCDDGIVHYLVTSAQGRKCEVTGADSTTTIISGAIDW